MVVGVGIDIVSPTKFETAAKKWGQSFLDRIFSASEISHLVPGKIYYQRLAARFAAKEAVIKALGKTQTLALRDIEITNLPTGAPICRFNKPINIEVMISISHINEFAVATAVAQKKEETG